MNADNTKNGGPITPDEAFDIAQKLSNTGRIDEAVLQLEAILSVAPGHLNSLNYLASIFENQGNTEKALDIYEKLISYIPGHGYFFSRYNILKVRQTWGSPKEPRIKNPSKPVLGMTSLGQKGRFGNQILQYGFLRMLAIAQGAEIETPDWIGRDLFDLDDPYPSEPLAKLDEDKNNLKEGLYVDNRSRIINTDISGYFNYNTSLFAPYKDLFRSLYKPGSNISQRIQNCIEFVREKGTDLVAIHLRRGDFGAGKFWVAPEEWYLTWLNIIWPSLEKPVLYIASDDSDVVDRFAAYTPLSARDFTNPQPGAEYIEDYYILTNADVLAVSNSTFSGTAAILNNKAKLFVRPVLNTESLEEYAPWDSKIFSD